MWIEKFDLIMYINKKKHWSEVYTYDIAKIVLITHFKVIKSQEKSSSMHGLVSRCGIMYINTSQDRRTAAVVATCVVLGTLYNSRGCCVHDEQNICLFALGTQ